MFCLYRFVSEVIQHSLRGEYQLPIGKIDNSRRQGTQLEPHQRANLLQLLAARVLPSLADDENSCRWKIIKDHLETAANFDQHISIELRRFSLG